MYSTGHPSMGLYIAKQKIDEQVRDAEARRIAREVRRETRSAAASQPARRPWRIGRRIRATSHAHG